MTYEDWYRKLLASESRPDLRQGQVAWDFLYKTRRDLDMDLPTEADPFVQDENLPAFLAYVKANWGISVAVTPGAVVVNSVDLVIDEPIAKVLLAECQTKGFEVRGITGTTVVLGTLATTLYAAEGTDAFTEVRVDGLPGEDWHCEAFASRYTCHIYLWRMSADAATREVLGDAALMSAHRLELPFGCDPAATR